MIPKCLGPMILSLIGTGVIFVSCGDEGELDKPIDKKIEQAIAIDDEGELVKDKPPARRNRHWVSRCLSRLPNNSRNPNRNHHKLNSSRNRSQSHRLPFRGCLMT